MNPILFGFFILFFGFMGGVIGWTARGYYAEKELFAVQEERDRLWDKAAANVTAQRAGRRGHDEEQR
jgi:hypothetical protein